MKNTRPFHIVFHVLKVHLIKICKIEPPDLLFLVIFISFIFSFLTDSLKPPQPLNGQNPLSVTKVFCRCYLKYVAS